MPARADTAKQVPMIGFKADLKEETCFSAGVEVLSISDIVICFTGDLVVPLVPTSRRN